VPDDQLSLAIGRRGQNVRLASQLTGHQIDIMTEEEASERRSREFAERSKMFEEELDVDETLSQLLVAEGFQGAGGGRLRRSVRTRRDRRLRRGSRRGTCRTALLKRWSGRKKAIVPLAANWASRMTSPSYRI
jgi:hypothetical protein